MLPDDEFAPPGYGETDEMAPASTTISSSAQESFPAVTPLPTTIEHTSPPSFSMSADKDAGNVKPTANRTDLTPNEIGSQDAALDAEMLLSCDDSTGTAQQNQPQINMQTPSATPAPFPASPPLSMPMRTSGPSLARKIARGHTRIPTPTSRQKYAQASPTTPVQFNQAFSPNSVQDDQADPTSAFVQASATDQHCPDAEMTGMATEQLPLSDRQPDHPINVNNQHPDTAALQAFSSEDGEQFDTADGRRLAAHVDQSNEQSIRYFAKELDAHLEQSEQRRRGDLIEAVNLLKSTVDGIGAKISGDDTETAQALIKAMNKIDVSVRELTKSQVEATKKADAAHAEILEEMRSNHAEMKRMREEFANELRKNREENTTGHVKIVREIEQSRIKAEKEMRLNKAQIESQVIQSRVQIEHGVRESQYAILGEQSKINIKIEDEVKKVKGLVIRDFVNRSLTSISPSPSPSPQPTLIKKALLLSVSIDNHDPLSKYADDSNPIAMKVGQAHDVNEIIKLFNQSYDVPAQVMPASESRLFILKRIKVPGEQGEAAVMNINSSSMWSAWVNDVLVHQEDRIKVEVLFKLARFCDRSSKKRKVDSDGQGKEVDGEDVGTGRNYFRADAW